MDKRIAYKFVSWDVAPLEAFKNTLAYKVKEKLINKKKLTRDEKDNLISSMGFNFRNGKYNQGGWLFDFNDYLKTYLVKQYDRWEEYKAFDKTSLKTILYGTIQRIVEID